MGMHAVELDENFPIVETTLAADGPAGLRALQWDPPASVATDASVLSVLMPTGGGPGGGYAFSTRTVTTNTTAADGELLQVNAAAGTVTILPPVAPLTAGAAFTLAKIDESDNSVIFNAPVSGDDEGAEIVASHAAATFVWDGTTWLIVSVNTSYSGDAAITALEASIPETARDTLGTALVAGTNLTKTVDDTANTITLAAPGVVTQSALDAVVAAIPETARDALGGALQAGAGISLVVDDTNNQIIITATAGGGSGGGLTTEDAQDVVYALLAAGSHTGVTFTYNDAGDALSATVAAPAWSAVTGKPTFAAVATSGSASDLTTGTLPDTVIPAAITRDSELSALSSSTTTALAGKAATAHTHPVTELATTAGIRSSTTFLRGDGTWNTPTFASAGPVGGVQSSGYSPTVTPNAGNGTHFRYSASGSMTINAPTGGVDGQRVLVEVQAVGGSRTVSVSSSVELSAAAPARTTTIPSGQWGYFALLNRDGTHRLMAIDPLPPT